MKLAILGLVLLAGCIADVQAENRPRPAAPADRLGSSAQHLGGTLFQATAVGGVFAALEGVAGTDDDPLCFSYGVQVVVGCSSQQLAGWALSSPADITSLNTTSGLTDAQGADGRFPAAVVFAGTYRSFNGSPAAFTTPGAAGSVGRREGVCRVGAAGAFTGRPCRVAADCDAAGATQTCATLAADCAPAASCFARITCAFLYATSSDCSWTNE